MGTSQATNSILFTVDKAIGFHTDLTLSKNIYELLRKHLKKKNVDVLSPYEKIANDEMKCYPPSSTIEINQTGTTRRKIVKVILLNFRSNLGHKDKLEVI